MKIEKIQLCLVECFCNKCLELCYSDNTVFVKPKSIVREITLIIKLKVDVRFQFQSARFIYR